jgi:hypothetical protein
VSGDALWFFEHGRRLKLHSAAASGIWQTWKREAYRVATQVARTVAAIPATSVAATLTSAVVTLAVDRGL